jgi:predicted AAA+ superfamily ATPase
VIEFLRETFHRLIDDVSCVKHRYLYEKLSLNNRLTGIVGPRGVGKTTLMLQIIKQKLPKDTRAFYLSADNIYFQKNLLIEFIADLYRYENIDHFFVDEVHRYPNWDQELKNIYDSFPKVKVVFSGSSSIDIVKGGYDLSRRASLYYLHGLSILEYLDFQHDIVHPAILLEDLIQHPQTYTQSLAAIPKLMGHFQDYLASGYYPFYSEDRQDFYKKLDRTIDKTIYEDIASFYQLKTQNLIYFKRILNFLSSIPPGEISVNNLAQNLQIDNKTIDSYLHILNDVALIRIISGSDGGNKLLRKPIKIFINNTTLLQALNYFLGASLSVGTMRELFFVQSILNAEHQLFNGKIGDYTVQKYFFEIGGPNKGREQLQNEESGFLVKDGILHAGHKTLPLYLFGFLY